MANGVMIVSGQLATVEYVVWGYKTDQEPVQILDLQTAGQIVQGMQPNIDYVIWECARNQDVLVSRQD